MKQKTKQPLTRQQKAVLDAIRDHLAMHDIAPTYQEIADALSLKRPTVAAHLSSLQEKGWLTKTRKWNSVKLVEDEA
jgi:DNA-binding MarR family transcriptional regulator